MNTIKTMKDLPESERPYEKAWTYGTASMSDAELLAVVLRCGSPGETSLDLAIRLVTELKVHGGLGALLTMSPQELTRCRGIGKVKAIQLLCVGELSRRIARNRIQEEITLKSPQLIASYYMEEMRHLRQEETRAAFFDTRCRLIHTSVITRGTVNASLITPREVFLEALKYQAVYLILLHNHPSGDPTPSQDDLLLTRRMQEAGRLMEIPLMDHIVIGDNCYVSLKERGLIKE